ncbi:MAG: acyl-[acyl-carrier-protein]--UDP-N-acetylglucosamine O-acyltransferase, partial [Lacisediminimonas sp.]|nr:acyl-[acyl-carrier-protein]--UDP-N-acetylglucosamine O-acyltransferase [Lacisediminimonas sp.]
GLRRRGFSPDEIQGIRTAYRLLYKSSLTLEEAKTALDAEAAANLAAAPHILALRQFLDSASRGIVR